MIQRTVIRKLPSLTHANQLFSVLYYQIALVSPIMLGHGFFYFLLEG